MEKSKPKAKDQSSLDNVNEAEVKNGQKPMAVSAVGQKPLNSSLNRVLKHSSIFWVSFSILAGAIESLCFWITEKASTAEIFFSRSKLCRKAISRVKDLSLKSSGLAFFQSATFFVLSSGFSPTGSKN